MGGYLLFLSKDLFTVFIGIELLSFPLFGMIGYFSFKNEINLEASFKYFIISIISSIFLLFGLSLIYLSSGNLSFFLLQSMNFLSHSYKFNLVFLFGIAILYISFFIKFSVFPFYIWISDIYAGTSFVVLTYFSNAIKIVLFFLILKFFSIFSYVHLSFSYFLLKLIIIFSIFFGSILSLFQDNFKRFIGYSSITHSGYLMIPLIFLNSGDLSLEVVKISLLAYFLNSIVLFSSMYLISLSLNKNKRYFIKNYEGIFWESPILSISIMISCFSMIGIPLTIGFFGKFFLLRCLVQENQVFLILSVFFGSIVSLYYYFNFIKKFFYKSRINSYKNVFFQKKIYIFYKIFIFLLSLAIIFCGCNLKILKFLMFNF
jgi:NADH-quinone oxidoreductase subunit N